MQALTAMCEGAAADAEAVECQFRNFAAALDRQLAAVQADAARTRGDTHMEELYQVIMPSWRMLHGLI